MAKIRASPKWQVVYCLTLQEPTMHIVMQHPSTCVNMAKLNLHM